MRISDWSSDVCSSDLTVKALLAASAATVKDPKGTAAAIQGKFFAKVKPEVVEAAVKDMTDGIANPRFTAADIANVIAFASETGTKFDKPLDAKKGENDFWTNAIIDAAKKRSEEHTSELQSLMRT